MFLQAKNSITSVTLLLLMVIPNQASAQFTLTIEIIKLRSNSGKILVLVYDENQKEVIASIGSIEDEKCVLTIKDLKPEKYAFKYFHDENGNSELETNWMGIPTEGFGFSNNASGRFGPPSFDKWIFELNEDKTLICIPKYF